ncbi:MAG: cytochrome C oxidase subunit IV family protein [Desulfobacter sp.]|nr:cytochrome C oxidase subunit IV family protein [Desulfobacter sp.]WDP86819.1 MAG: cytochrome C oxidase subunit IV family protein [Desulfobacter sp.]
MENHPPILSYKLQATVLFFLLVLTGITVGASYVDLGRFNVWIALGIASVKASLVLMFFMHLKFESRMLVISFLSTIGFLAIMIGFTFWDIAFR